MNRWYFYEIVKRLIQSLNLSQYKYEQAIQKLEDLTDFLFD